MILVELEIEDFKQFAGKHCFGPSPEGIFAVIGHNGAGKTTLFEAIEWCLYQPREIGSGEIPPRGRVANRPRVKLTLLNPDTGVRHVVQRWQNKSRVADAEIYREDEPESRIVQGSRPTSEYVAKTLIGLSHRAFVSTFFTRQKELTFFGDLKETDRRREVGRLLGMETIREAQKSIGEERATVQQRSKALELQGNEANADRDFAAELIDANTAVDEAMESQSRAISQQQLAETTHSAARRELERLGDLERQDAAHRAQLERVDGDIRAATAKKQTVEAELLRMDESAAERGRLIAVGKLADERRASVQTFELTKERYQNLLRLRTDHNRAVNSLEEIGKELKKTLAAVPAGAPSGWVWNDGVEPPAIAAGRLAGVAADIDPSAIEREYVALTRAYELDATVAQSRAKLTRMTEHLATLEAEQAALIAAGDPRRLREDLARKRDECLRAVEQADGRLTALIEEQERLQPVLARLMVQEPDTTCPTCGRPIEGNDIAITIGLFESKLATLASVQAELTTIRSVSSAEALETSKQIKAVDERIKALDTLNGRIQDGGRMIAGATQELADQEAELASHLTAAGLTAIPESAAIERANTRLTIARKLGGTLPMLRRLETDALRAVDDRDALARDIAAMGEVRYDLAAHENARQMLRASESAAARIGQIETMLAARPAREAEVSTLIGEIERFLAERAAITTAKAALGFVSDALTAARDAERAALAAERIAREARTAADSAHASAVRSREAILTEQARIAKLIERAAQESRRAGELDTMYREFNFFEQFVADHLTPQLADYTGELLRAITEGKYDEVAFDGNFGIRIKDGEHETFPIDEFSGGERDVIALCARLALSRLIGGQANNPPGFMVLDEVFGSLDRERRVQVLDALGALAGTADAYHQLFIISHVDDVRASPIFNEVWRVAEGMDGISRLENLNVTGGFEDA